MGGFFVPREISFQGEFLAISGLGGFCRVWYDCGMKTNQDEILVPRDEFQAFMAWRSSFASEAFTSLEARKHKKGLAEIANGDCISLVQLKNELAATSR